MKLFKYLALFVLMIAAMPTLAETEGWTLQREKDGVSVYTREVKDSAFKAFKGETVLEVELNRAMALMDDTAACVEWMHSCKSPILIRKLSPLQRYSYMVNDLPWPVKDRALLLQATISQELPSRVVTVALTTLDPETLADSDRKRVPDDGGIVLIEKANGFFRFTPLNEKQTHVEYQMHTEPSGALPASLVNSMVVDTPFYTLKSMRDVVKAEKYTDFRPF